MVLPCHDLSVVFEDNKKTEAVVFWVIAPCSAVVGYQRFGGRDATNFRVEVRNEVYEEFPGHGLKVKERSKRIRNPSSRI